MAVHAVVVYAKVNKEMKRMELEKFSVEYLGGHPDYMKKARGELKITETEVSFWSGLRKQERFRIPLKDIKKVDFQEQNKITLTRALVFGLGALIFKKKKKYLVFYFDVAGMESGTIFDFPRGFRDRTKKKLMQTIIERKRKLLGETQR